MKKVERAGGTGQCDADATALLEWYDRSARRLPWRAGPGAARQDPYRVWLSEIMLQQTTVASATPYFERFLARWPTVEALAASPLDDLLAAWAGLGYYARARNLHKCAVAVAAAGGRFPEDEATLRALPGIGEYTAAAIAAIAFDRPATVVDGNVERVVARRFAIETPLPTAKAEIKARAAELTPIARPGDYAQAMMDLGATVCTPRRPACGLCPWVDRCAARAAGVQAELPRKLKKPAKPVRLGRAYLALDDAGRVLLERRPARGLLGGMLGLPGGAWTDATGGDPQGSPPFDAPWRDLAVEARHTFTHFHLRLAIEGARIRSRPPGDDQLWIDRRALGDRAIPTLMAKALTLGLSALDGD